LGNRFKKNLTRLGRLIGVGYETLGHPLLTHGKVVAWGFLNFPHLDVLGQQTFGTMLDVCTKPNKQTNK